MDIKHYLAILRRWGWIMVVCMLLASVASYWFTSRQKPVYEARARYLVGPAVDNPNVSSNDLRASSQAGQTYAELATSRPIVQNAINKLKIDADPASMVKNITATWIDTSQILNIRVRTSDPETAALMANAIGDALIERSPNGPASTQALRRQESLKRVAELQEKTLATESEISRVADEIQKTTDQVVQRALIVRFDQLSAQLVMDRSSLAQEQGALQNSGTNQILIVESAVPEPKPISPDVQRNVLAALLAGLVLGLAAMLMFEYFTDVIYDPQELRKVTGLPYLGGIARHKRMRGKGIAHFVVYAQPDTLATESYRMLRTNLHMIGADPHQAVLLITSPARGDGKSEIAANLAISLAQAGKQVILIDANLRRPRLGMLFGLPMSHGVSSIGHASMSIIKPVQISEMPGLSVVPSGTPVLNASEIVGSQYMQQLLLKFKTQADIIIIDSPPLLYSDALALALLVDGVLLVTQAGATGREDTAKSVENLRLIDAPLIGTVLNRVKPGPAYFYYRSRASLRRSWKPDTTLLPDRVAMQSSHQHVAAMLESAAQKIEPLNPSQGAGSSSLVSGNGGALPGDDVHGGGRQVRRLRDRR